ncbi:MAG: AAA family ATPase [Chloroflexi bacterium]|nr:AAA family ATPase [Chloroflexota bacterium]
MSEETTSSQGMRAGPSGAASPSAGTVKGERRVITALFCDVAGSTAIAGKLDPEEWAEIMNRAFELLTPPVARYEGTVARLMGDALLAFFGAPVAHEDDPQRAILAGLDILDAIKPFREELQREHGLDFNVRVGINTGHVVVGDVGSAIASEYTAMGDAVNVAARMEQTAQPGTIQVSGDTYRVIAPLFEFESLGRIEVKGKSEPVEAYRVLGVKARPGRLRGIPGIAAPLVGRDREFAQLKSAFDELVRGRGQIVCVIGEAGLGKSRLLDELRQVWTRDHGQRFWTVSHGVAYESSRPYGLFQQRMLEVFGVELDDPPAVIHRKVAEGMRAQGMPEEQIALCTIAVERIIAAKTLHEAPAVSADAIKAEIRSQMYAAWRRLPADTPAVLVFDDLHWSDHASAEMIMHLMQLAEEKPMLFIFAFRPERQSPAWQVKLKAETDFGDRYTEIFLRPLDAQDTDQLVSALLKIADLPPELRQLILRKTEGNPYFVEEIVRTLIEQDVVYQTDDGLHWKTATRVEDIAIPDSLQALLMARIDRLDRETRATLQLASVIGRSFYYRVLKSISDSAMALDKHLLSLQRVELVREANLLPELLYMFKHELARDAAYSSILNRNRREFHRRVAEAIEALFPDKLEENAHRLAQHFETAGDFGRAMKYYTMAGEAAAGMSANVEAAGHYGRAIETAGRSGAAADEKTRLEARRATLLALSQSGHVA